MLLGQLLYKCWTGLSWENEGNENVFWFFYTVCEAFGLRDFMFSCWLSAVDIPLLWEPRLPLDFPCVLLDYCNAFPELLKVVAHTLQILQDCLKCLFNQLTLGKCSEAFWSGLHHASHQSGYSWTGLGSVVCISIQRGGYSWGGL